MTSRHNWPWAFTMLATLIGYLAWYLATKPHFAWALLIAAAFGLVVGAAAAAIRLLSYVVRLRRQ